ncbi:MAG: carboxypeptidase regulatory-like domain-containing protein [Myxococcales bacterium]|nr:carboxypeptidase regulatory-like domain-containing protein [Myxococcales bacterium]
MRNLLGGAAVLALALGPSGVALATECGDLRTQAAGWRAALTVEEQLSSTLADATKAKHQSAAKEAATALKLIEKKLSAACAPRRVSIAALPLGYVAVPPGNGSRSWIEPGDRFGIALTTLAGAKGGLVFNDALTVSVPAGGRWESEAKGPSDSELELMVAIDAQLTVEEPAAGVGSWRIDLKGAPLLVPLGKVKACAASDGGDVGGARLAASTCQMLLKVDPLGSATALPERGRASLFGEWQYGDGAGFEIGDELADVPASGAPPRLDLLLDLSAAIPGVSDGKRLAVSLGLNRKTSAAGTVMKLTHECAGDAACEEQWFTVSIWFDRIFAVPFVQRRFHSGTPVKVIGRITDRLGKPMGGQRVMATGEGRRVFAITDSEGKYHFEWLPSGELSLAAVGKKLGAKTRSEYVRPFSLGLVTGTAPKILVDRLLE